MHGLRHRGYKDNSPLMKAYDQAQKRRMSGLTRAHKRLNKENAEHLDELRKSTYAKYISKAARSSSYNMKDAETSDQDADYHNARGNEYHPNNMTPGNTLKSEPTAKMHYKMADKHRAAAGKSRAKMLKRHKGVDRALRLMMQK